MPTDDAESSHADTPAPKRPWSRWWPAVCALLGVVPALLSSPGRMPADTKLGLYLDPGGLTSGAPSTFDPSIYAGWVPHQQIAYLWPQGPWYVVFDTLGVPDWIAHRLWIGAVLTLAGCGVGWALRRLGFGVTAALTGALVYQLSPYVLPYVSRTSSLLLPFAALGWVVGATVLATADPRRVPWRWPAVIALVVATVGAPNATALLMIVPAPLLVLVGVARRGPAERRTAAIVATLTTIGCAAVSLWWLAMLVVQRAHGADVLSYSESLGAVSASSTAPEVLRGLGYWLFYVRDHIGATTTASVDHLDSPTFVVLGFTAAITPLVGLLAERTERARLGARCVVLGALLAIGVHPIDDPSPIAELLTGDPRSGAALALRSTARAVPVVLFGAAIGAAALVQSTRWPNNWGLTPVVRRVGTGAVIVGLVLASTPSWWTLGLVDPGLDRDSDPPAAWTDAAGRLDDDPAFGRVLQLPGAEFGAFDWGVTVDQPLPLLVERPVVTRDLLPLGSAAAMDLAFALDDRFQDGWAEPASIGPVARWLGVDRIWIAGDLDVERYATARPGVTDDVVDRAEIGTPTSFGEPAVPGVSVIDEELLGVPAASAPIAPVRVVELDDPGNLVRVTTDEVVVVGSGDGLVDAAAAGVLDGSELVRYAAAPGAEGVPPSGHVVVTDSHRDRAHHWRTSQDVHGFTESAAAQPDLLRQDEADVRLPVFDDVAAHAVTDDDRTVSVQRGPVTASATGYGEPFSYLPEHRPVMAIDGDPATAWTVGEHADPIGERLVLRVSDGSSADRFVVRQPHRPDDRAITQIAVEASGRRTLHALDDRSWSVDGQTLDVADPIRGDVVIEIVGVSAGRPSGVGFAEVDLGLGPTTEWIRTPQSAGELDADRIDVVVTRLRAEATDRWRDDPEPVLRRVVPLPTLVGDDDSVATVAGTVRLDARAGGAALAELLGDGAVSSDHLLGVPLVRGDAAIDGDPATSWVTPFGSPVGPSLTFPDGAGRIDRIAIDQPDGPYSTITRIRLGDAAGSQDLDIPPDGSIIELERSFDVATATLTIIGADLATTIDRRFGDEVVLPAAIAELDLGADATLRQPVSTIGVECDSGWLQVDGNDVPISFEASTDDLLDGTGITATTCDEVAVGESEVVVSADAPAPFQFDRVHLALGPRPEPSEPPTWSVEPGADPRVVTVDACPDGCWVVLGHGIDDQWRASVDGRTLDGPTLVDGNANGWWLAPFTTPTTVDFAWGAQRPITVALVASVLVVFGLAVALLVVRLRRREPITVTGPAFWADDRPARDPSWLAPLAAVVLAALAISPVAAVPVAAVAGATYWAARRGIALGRMVGLVAIGALALGAAGIALVVWRQHPFPGLNWPGRFESWHRPMAAALVVFLLGVETAPDRRRRTRAQRDEPDESVPSHRRATSSVASVRALIANRRRARDGDSWYLLRRWFAIAAFGPVLLARPGQISADTKTYLSVDPGRLLSQASTMWDPSVGAGTVPHQNIGYLFPLGPYHWVLDTIGVPDWIAQRLVWGLLVFTASWGACRLGRLLGWSTTMAGVAGFAYGFSPFLLSYLARLSVILFPWAAMPWLIVLALRLVRRPSWWRAAAFAGVIALVGSVNATSLVLAGLGPLVFVLADLWTRRTTIRRSLDGVARIGLLSLAVSAWWIAGLAVQGSAGLPILRFTETYRAISGASTPAEVVRGLGYWFFYGGDRLDHWIGPSSSYTNEGWLILLGFGVAMLSLLGLLLDVPRRGTLVALLVVGMLVSVGGAPIDSPTVYGSWFDGFASDSTAGGALRSTTRAMPLVLLALGAGLGALADAARRWCTTHRLGGRRIDERVPVVAATGLLALQIFPWFIGTMATDSLLRADAVPAHVEALATELDAAGEGRVLIVPGSDFAYPRVGGTIDPILPGVLDRPVLYRELVPQGSEATADLLNAHERRLHDGWSEPEAWPTIARLFDATAVAALNDHQYERFRLVRPGNLWPDLLEAFGPTDVAIGTADDTTEIDLVDGITYADPDAVRTFPLVAAWTDLDADDTRDGAPEPIVVRPADQLLVLDGSGDGLVDLAGAELIDPDAADALTVLARTSLDEPDVLADSTVDGAWWVVTDTNRRQSRRWSTIGSNVGPIETVEARIDLDPDAGDQRLRVFGTDVDPESTSADVTDRQTVAEHRGDIALVRSSYTGSRIASTPEDAPFMATDGDPATAWRTAVFDDARGLELRLDLRAPSDADHVVVVQPLTGVIDRFITRARIHLAGDDLQERTIDVTLDERSRTLDGQRIDLPTGPAFTTLRFEILDDNLGPLATYAGRPGVGLAELRLPGIDDDRVVRLPIVGDVPPADDRLTYVFTRERIDAATQNRFAPEPSMHRVFDVPHDRVVSARLELRLSAGAADQIRANTLGIPGAPTSNRRLAGSATVSALAALDGDPTTAWTTPIDAVVGSSITIPADGSPIERLVVQVRDDDLHSVPTQLAVSDGAAVEVVAVDIADGRVDVPWPTQLDSTTSQVTITVDAIDERIADEYFSGLPQTLPVAVAEIELLGAAGERRAAPRIDLDASLSELPCRSDLLSIDGEPLAVRLAGTVGAALRGDELIATTCDDGPIRLAPGEHRIDTVRGDGTGLEVDRIVLDDRVDDEASEAVEPVAVSVDRSSATELTVDVAASDADRWLVLQESWNTGWEATIDGRSLGEPVLVDGYANGWVLPAGDAGTVRLEWAPQGTVDLGIIISAIAGSIILVLLGLRLRRPDDPVPIDDDPDTDDDARIEGSIPIIGAVGLAVVGIVMVGLLPTAVAVGVTVIARRHRVPWLVAAVVIVAIGLTGGWIAVAETIRDHADSPDWPSTFSWTAPLVWAAVATVVAGSIGFRRR